MSEYISARQMIRKELEALFSTVEGVTFRERLAPQGSKPHGIWKVIDSAAEQDPKRENGKLETTQCLLEVQYKGDAADIDDMTDSLLQSVRDALMGYRAGGVGYNAGIERGTMIGFDYHTHHPRIKDGANGSVDATLYILFVAQYRQERKRNGAAG